MIKRPLRGVKLRVARTINTYGLLIIITTIHLRAAVHNILIYYGPGCNRLGQAVASGSLPR